MVRQLMNKKLNNKKGFTLAELLVVIAILAILIAIAVPVFSGMVADANLRVNQANIRSVRSAGVAHILTRLDQADSNGTKKLNTGLETGKGWVAIATVDNNGDVQNLKVLVVSTLSAHKNGICPGDQINNKTVGSYTSLDSISNFEDLVDDTSDPFATLRPTTNGNEYYTVQAVISDLDPLP